MRLILKNAVCGQARDLVDSRGSRVLRAAVRACRNLVLLAGVGVHCRLSECVAGSEPFSESDRSGGRGTPQEGRSDTRDPCHSEARDDGTVLLLRSLARRVRTRPSVRVVVHAGGGVDTRRRHGGRRARGSDAGRLPKPLRRSHDHPRSGSADRDHRPVRHCAASHVFGCPVIRSTWQRCATGCCPWPGDARPAEPSRSARPRRPDRCGHE